MTNKTAITLYGNVGGDPETRTIPGKQVTKQFYDPIIDDMVEREFTTPEREARTFSIGFHEKPYNEADHAKAVAAHLGTDHHELYVDDTAVRDVIPMLPAMYCEPLNSSRMRAAPLMRSSSMRSSSCTR